MMVLYFVLYYSACVALLVLAEMFMNRLSVYEALKNWFIDDDVLVSIFGVLTMPIVVPVTLIHTYVIRKDPLPIKIKFRW